MTPVESSGLWVGQPGTLEHLDELAVGFIRAYAEQEKQNILEQTIHYKNANLTDDDNVRSADYYIRIMVCIAVRTVVD